MQRAYRPLVGLLGCLAVAGCASAMGSAMPAAPVVAAAGKAAVPRSCIDLTGIQIDTRTKIGSATVIPASSDAPERCEVKGAIAPVSAGAYPINFAVLLPSEWNGEAIQGGNGGYAGTIRMADAPRWSDPASAKAFPFRGYALYGDDTGHPASVGASFALSDEALRNYGYASIKQVKDAATKIIALRFGRPPSRTYFVGFSTGGRQGLTAAQRYPADYDGIIIGDPVQNLSLLFLNHIQATRPFRGAGYINPEEQALLGKFVVSACDKQDGLEDGLIAAPLQCHPDITPLRCAGGKDTGNDCLSDAQIKAINESRRPVTVPYPLANGLTTYRGKPRGAETLDGGEVYRMDYIPDPATGESGLTSRLGSPFVKFFLARDAHYDVDTFDWHSRQFETEMKRVSEIIDSTSVDLEAFRKRGGKIILYAGGLSEVPPAETAHFYDRLVKHMGQAAVDDFVRFYMFPNVNHGSVTLGGSPLGADLMGALEGWVEHGHAPNVLVNKRPDPSEATPEWPLCLYPNYPRYVAGNVQSAGSYRCTARDR